MAKIKLTLPVIGSGGGSGGVTNLFYTASPTQGVVTSDTGNDAIIPLADNTNAGLISAAEKTRIANDLVPYTGATTNVDLGEYQLTAGQVSFDQTPSGTTGAGVLRWNDVDGTLDLGLKGGNVTLQVGQEQIVRVVNKTGANLLESQYKVVRIRIAAEGGAQGQRLAVVLAQASNDGDSVTTLGVVTENIDNNQEGFITTFGNVSSINTTGSLQGETWVDGDVLYLSPTIPGQLTNIKPIAPQHSVTIGYVVYVHVTNGKIFVKVDNGYELDELHNVLINTPVNNQILTYESATSLWKNKTVSDALGFTPVNPILNINTTSPLLGGGNLTSDRTLSIQQSTNVQDGYLSSTDWNIFNNKQPAGAYITSLTGEVTASGAGAAVATLSTSAVTGKILTGLNITGGSISAADSILSAFGKVQSQINGVLGGSIFQTTWNASTNTPTLTSSVGTKGYYYIVDVAGSTNLDGITEWKMGDWVIYDGTVWRKVDNTDAVSSVNGFTGAVSLTTSNITEGTNLYYTEGRVSANTDVAANTAARHSAVTLGTTNGLSLFGQQISLGLSSTSTIGALSSTDWNVFNNKQNALGFTPENVANKSDSYTASSSTTYSSTKALVDGLTTKSNDANVVHKTGDETKSGKLNLSNVNLYLVPSPIFSGLTDTGVAGNLNGLYYYSVNYYNALGETDTSGEQSISVTNKQVSVTLPISANTSVIGRRLYRTVANAFDPVIKYLVADIPNNTATSYVDNLVDGSLGVPVPRVNTTGGQLFNNNDRVGFASGGTTSFGLNSALQSTGYANSSFGFGSLTDNTTGYRNTAGGVFSLYKNTTGYNNTGWGVHSLNDNTSGWDNNAFGFSALISNTTGISNSAFGTFALSQNLTGSNNIAFGASSLQYNTAGNNTAVGYNSLQNNTTGSGNIGLGYQAGRDNSTGNFNIAIGQGALEKMNDAWFTTAIGFQTGFNATSLAWGNTFVGAESGYNASGGNNVFLGKAAGYFETGGNKLFIDNQQRTNESDARTSALIYGEFNATPSSQQLAVNGNLKAISLNLSTAPTTSTGSYDILTRNSGTGVVEKLGNNRLLIGGATDNGIDQIQSNGTISASPATLSNQVVVKSQHDLKADKGIRITNASTTGSYAIDWNAGDVWQLTLTGATTLTDTNLPTGTATKVIEFLITGAFAWTPPAYWVELPSSQAYDGAKQNHVIISCINGTGGTELVYYSNEPTT